MLQIVDLLPDRDKFPVVDQSIFQKLAQGADTLGYDPVLVHLRHQMQGVQRVEQKVGVDLVLEHPKFQLSFFCFAHLPLFQQQLDLRDHTVNVIRQVGQFIVALVLNPHLQIAVGYGLADLDHMVDGMRDAQIGVECHGQRHSHHQKGDDQDLAGDLRASVQRIGVQVDEQKRKDRGDQAGDHQPVFYFQISQADQGEVLKRAVVVVFRGHTGSFHAGIMEAPTVFRGRIQYTGFLHSMYILIGNRKIIHRKQKIIHTLFFNKQFCKFIFILEFKIIHTKDKILSIHFYAIFIK